MGNAWKEHQQRMKDAKDSSLKARCQQLVSAGKRVEAIRLYRLETGANLRRAMADLALKHW